MSHPINHRDFKFAVGTESLLGVMSKTQAFWLADSDSSKIVIAFENLITSPQTHYWSCSGWSVSAEPALWRCRLESVLQQRELLYIRVFCRYIHEVFVESSGSLRVSGYGGVEIWTFFKKP